jgi:hypothetical protein
MVGTNVSSRIMQWRSCACATRSHAIHRGSRRVDGLAKLDDGVASDVGGQALSLWQMLLKENATGVGWKRLVDGATDDLCALVVLVVRVDALALFEHLGTDGLLDLADARLGQRQSLVGQLLGRKQRRARYSPSAAPAKHPADPAPHRVARCWRPRTPRVATSPCLVDEIGPIAQALWWA